jgi:hypothetical protein
MNVASQEPCKELYELSGWKGTHQNYNSEGHTVEAFTFNNICPAYDLGYLLRKLPNHLSGNLVIEADGTPEDRWCAYYDARPVVLKSYYNDTPEDALANLAITLIKQGLLTPKNERTGSV